MTTILCLCVVIAVVIAWVITYRNAKARYDSSLLAKETELQDKTRLISNMEIKIAQNESIIKTQGEDLIRKDYEIQNEKNLRSQEKQLHEEALKKLEDSQEKAIDAAKKALALENAEALKKHEDELNKKASESMKAIADNLGKDLKDMKDSFEAQKLEHAKNTSSITTQFEKTAQLLVQTTEKVGNKADNLADALRGKNKMQGIFGESVLENLLQQEGLRPGIDYETEFYLRDKKGKIIVNEDTEKKMRPDFVIHFPDGTDVLLDAKVSLSALSDYFAAETDQEREDAAVRNLESVKNHIKELTTKEYQKYLKGSKTLDFVIMFIPNYGAYQLAKQQDPEVFANAFHDDKVLILTEETLIPFLATINAARIQKEQLENVADIIKKSEQVVDRICLFCKENATLGEALDKAVNIYKKNTSRLTDSKQSILKAAHEVVQLGIVPTKELPPLETLIEE